MIKKCWTFHNHQQQNDPYIFKKKTLKAIDKLIRLGYGNSSPLFIKIHGAIKRDNPARPGSTHHELMI